MGLKPIPGPPLNLVGVGNSQKTRSTVRYKIPLVDTGGRTVEVAAYGMSHIMDPLETVDPKQMRAIFSEAPTGGIEAASGGVDLLMGHDNMRLFPVEQRRMEDALLWRSRFGTGWIASGRPPTPGDRVPAKGKATSAGVTVSADTAVSADAAISADAAANAEAAVGAEVAVGAGTAISADAAANAEAAVGAEVAVGAGTATSADATVSADVAVSTGPATNTSSAIGTGKAAKKKKATAAKDPAATDARTRLRARSQVGSAEDSRGQQQTERPEGSTHGSQPTNPSRAVPPVHIEGGIFQPSDFLSAEALGTDMPRRCKNCLKCKECQFRADSLTFKENQEYQVILDGLKFDEKEMDSILPLLHTSDGTDGQPRPGLQVHAVPGEEVG
jgi:hypothetical protein